ncbi:MAG TPA: hypothetical protein VJ201_03685 [Candidatus Babeliales bacterium]|nr:hypothetical protein [Candidatus Babeliales bacterium]
MFVKLSIYPIFLLLFISSVSFSMNDSRKNPVNSIDDNFQNVVSNHGPYKPKGEYSDPDKINYEFNEKLIEAAPEEIKLLIGGLKDCEMASENSYLKKLLLYGHSGNGKTELAKAIGIAVFGKYYYIPTHYAFSSCEGCHQDLHIEINQLIQKGEPIAVIFEDVNWKSSHTNISGCFASLLDCCEKEAPFLFLIAIACDELYECHEQFIRKFEDNLVHVPYPNFSTRKQIVSYCLNKWKHNLTTNDITDLAQRFEGITCRNIEHFIDNASMFSLMNNEIITLEEIRLTEETNPYTPSKYERLAKLLNVPIERIIEFYSRKPY